MIFTNLSRTIEKYEKIIDRAHHDCNDVSPDERDYIEYIGFAIAQSVIADIGKINSLQIANHILAHYVNDMEY